MVNSDRFQIYIVTFSYSSRLFLCMLVPTQVNDQGCNWRMIRSGIKYYYDFPFLFYSCFLQPQFSSTPASVNVPVSQRQVLGSLASQENIRQQVDLTRFPELCKLATYPGSVFFPYCMRGRARTRLHLLHDISLDPHPQPSFPSLAC